MSNLDKPLETIIEGDSKKSKLKLFALIGVFLITLIVVIVAFFLIKNNHNTFKIVQDSNVAGEAVNTLIQKRGDEITITARDIEGYRFIGWKVGNENISDSKTYTFIIDDNIPTKYTAVYAQEFNIEVDVRINNGSVTVNKDVAIKDEEVIITVTPDEYYALKTLKCKKGTIEIGITDNIFVMPAGDVVVTAEFEKIGFLVTIPEEQVGYAITNINGTRFNTTNIKANENISFKVQVAQAYSRNDIVVKNNQTILLADNNGIYTIENITDNVNIIVEGIEGVNTYLVTFPNTEGIVLKNPDDTNFDITDVEYDSTLVFKLMLDQAYSQSLSNIIVRCNGIVLNLNQGVYTISNIRENIEITIEGVEINTYSVTSPQVQEHYTLRNLDNTTFELVAVDYGEQIVFFVDIDAPYSKSEVVVKNNDVELVAVEGVYTISNIEEDVNITVEGITTINTYEVVFPENQEHYTIKNTDNTDFNTTSVEYGDTITFTIEILEPAYEQSIVVVKNNDVELVAVEGVYTISNIKEDINITVEGVQKELYTVTLSETQIGYTINNIDNTLFEMEVAEYGDTIKFKVVVDNGYLQSIGNLVVKNNTTILNQVDDVYIIEDIQSNVNIIVEGLEINSYTIDFSVEVAATKDNTSLESGDTVYHYDIITLSPVVPPLEGYFVVYTVTGAIAVDDQESTYQVTGNVFIEYSVEEYIGIPSDYSMLSFRNYSQEAPYTVQVGANPNKMPTGDLVIPNKIINDNIIYSVTITYSGSFQNCTGLTSVTIPSSMQAIWSYSFNGCANLKTIIFDDCTQLTLLGNYSFQDCTSLTSITIPASVVEIGQIKNGIDSRGKIFDGCTNLITIDFEDNAQYSSMDIFQNNAQLKNVTIPAGVRSIDTTFNNNTTIESIKIQAGITNIDNSAFQNCTKLTTVILDNVDVYNNATSTSVLGYLLNNAATVKVLASIVDDVNNINTYLNDENNYTKSEITNIDGKDYYIYTIV